MNTHLYESNISEDKSLQMTQIITFIRFKKYENRSIDWPQLRRVKPLMDGWSNVN